MGNEISSLLQPEPQVIRFLSRPVNVDLRKFWIPSFQEQGSQLLTVWDIDSNAREKLIETCSRGKKGFDPSTSKELLEYLFPNMTKGSIPEDPDDHSWRLILTVLDHNQTTIPTTLWGKIPSNAELQSQASLIFYRNYHHQHQFRPTIPFYIYNMLNTSLISDPELSHNFLETFPEFRTQILTANNILKAYKASEGKAISHLVPELIKSQVRGDYDRKLTPIIQPTLELACLRGDQQVVKYIADSSLILPLRLWKLLHDEYSGYDMRDYLSVRFDL